MRGKVIRKLKEKKIVVIIICVIILSIVYFLVQDAIDNFIFDSNGDIFSAEENSLNFGEEQEMGNDGEKKQVVEDVLEEDVDEDFEGEENATELGDAEYGLDDVRENLVGISKIYVYITGEVNNPGVVVLNEGSRIVDAINAAGGTTVKANVTKVNLVYVLDDGMKVNIPNDNDLKNNPDFEYITRNSGDGGSDDYTNSRADGMGVGNSSGTGTKNSYSVVNINTATQTELETLPGIGPSLALKIINYRKDNGKFSSIDQIKNVSGIGESKFDTLKDFITVF